MAIKNLAIETDVDSQGNEFVSEIESTYTETLADGTEVSAEITTAANPNDPTQVESQMTITEIAPDGTETVTEVTVAPDGTMNVDEQGSFAEEVVEAIFDGEINSNEITSENSTEAANLDDAPGNSEPEIGAADFTVGSEMFAPNVSPTDAAETYYAETPVDSAPAFAAPTFSEAPLSSPADAAFEDSAETDAASVAEQQAQAQAATDAQAAADEFVAVGDYAAAAEARQVAEDAAWEAGDDSMLGAYDAQDFTVAAEKQDEAAYYSEQQAQYAQAGDYESAREMAGKAEYATSDADWYAGGEDHSGQAAAEYASLDNAVWQEGLRDDALDNAAFQAEMGNYDAAESSLDNAAAYQANADYYGDLGEPGGEMAVFDPSSVVETGGSYDASLAAVDTGFDSAVDTSVDTTSFDSGTNDV